MDNRAKQRIQVNSYVNVSERKNDQTIGRIVDLTPDGMRLHCRKPIPRDRSFRLILKLPDSAYQTRMIRFEAKVVWCEPTSDPQHFETGLQLKNVAPEDQVVIEQFMQNSSFRDRWLRLDSNSLSDN